MTPSAAEQRYKRALESIAANSCCPPCREAGLVAKAALIEDDIRSTRTLQEHFRFWWKGLYTTGETRQMLQAVDEALAAVTVTPPLRHMRDYLLQASVLSGCPRKCFTLPPDQRILTGTAEEFFPRYCSQCQGIAEALAESANAAIRSLTKETV